MSGAFAGLLGGFSTIWDNVYNYWRDQVADNRAQRDFDYQKALQNQIFQREDTAVQRRMADLQAAGLNPNLAAGSAASAGAVVGRSNTPTSNYGGAAGNPVGTALDMAQHVAQLRNAREQNQILKNQERESKANADMAENANTLDTLNLYYQLGLEPHINLYGQNEIKPGWNFDDNLLFKNGSGYYIGTEVGRKGGRSFYGKSLYNSNSPLMQQLQWQYDNNKNSAFMLQKDADYYTADKVFGYIGDTARTIGNLTGGVGSIGSAYYNFRRRR